MTTFAEWQKGVPAEIRADALWTVTAYRLALFAADISWRDASLLVKDPRTVRLSGQLYDAVGSVGANVAEGYSRGSGRDRARFYEYALGSARESRHWYFEARHALGEAVVQHRIRLATEIIRLLLTMVPQQRAIAVREEVARYEASTTDFGGPSADLDDLLTNVPFAADGFA